MSFNPVTVLSTHTSKIQERGNIMSNNSNYNNDQQTISLPAGAHGVLSTCLTDNSPDYVWFDCEAEL